MVYVPIHCMFCYIKFAGPRATKLSTKLPVTGHVHVSIPDSFMSTCYMINLVYVPNISRYDI